jgi:tRNA (guanine-N(7)-)-methyltransferase subunit TRM82
MPKRPSAIVVTSDDSTILSADKFGDVYALPLMPSDNPVLQQRNPRHTKLSSPAASDLTVHTKRNLHSLRQQMLHSRESDKKEKSGLDFEHQLLLGHVSLLTDMVIASLQSGSSGHACSYILTADRDEHIRVSRGPPQAHVIENYCLGHTSFISKLCIPRWSPELLISGGGDDYLLVWNWLEGRVLQKVPLVDQPSEGTELAVCGIWAVSLAEPADPSKVSNVILVAIEG